MYTLILLITKKNIPLLQISIDYIRKNLKPSKIVAISSKKNIDDINKLNIEFLDEDTIYPNLTYQKIYSIIEKKHLDVNRTGWYFQQFLKYAYSTISQTDYYLSWDSDTIPLNLINYFSNGTPCFITKKEYHTPYFNTINKLFNNNVTRFDKSISFIAENMMFYVPYVKQIMSAINENTNLTGNDFFDKILDSIRPEEFIAGFSEFETYGNYVMKYYNESYKCINLRTMRLSSFILGLSPSDKQLNWAAKDYDIISFEPAPHNFSFLTKNKLLQKVISMKNFCKLAIPLRHFIDKLKHREVIDFD